MTLKHAWIEWHLTPHGWVRGSQRKDRYDTRADAPRDRVLTRVYHDHVTPPPALTLEHKCETTWEVGDVQVLARSVQQFGPHPGGFEKYLKVD